MGQSLVSVVIPCYNYGKFLPEAIASIENQTYQNWEIIISDDGSDEDTLKVVSDFRNHPLIRIIYLENGGPSRARNIAIRAAKGKYILPLDADDLISPAYMETAIRLLESNHNLGIVYCEAKFFGSNNEKWDLPEYSFPAILLGNRIFVTSFFRKQDWEKVGGFDEDFLDEWEDFDFWLKIIKLGRNVHRIEEVLFHYRKGHMSRCVKKGRELLPLFEQIVNNHKDLYSQNIMYLIEQILIKEELINTQAKEINAIKQEFDILVNSAEFRIGYYIKNCISLLLKRLRILYKQFMRN
ncbi:MAG: glycosyltransferase family 2 protein [Leptospiraceae bacterium]|jgi:glycosyltransferase involved in cell wall biosynthesis|nr:glycosyltransferase family 2 protein [Leptospiraceae bacterium]